MAVIGIARQGAGAEDELAAGCGRIGGGKRDLHAELVSGLRLALADALHLRSMQRIQLVPPAVLAPLPQQPGNEAERPGEGGLDGSAARDLAADVAEQAPQPGP